jgi:hypothetical protein
MTTKRSGGILFYYQWLSSRPAVRIGKSSIRNFKGTLKVEKFSLSTPKDTIALA